LADQSSIRATIHGHVQGVYFRSFIKERADELGLKGYACNSPDGVEVEIEAEGEKNKIERLIEFLWIGPPAARVEKVDVTWNKFTGQYSKFSIKR
jgi:acylphosphatase